MIPYYILPTIHLGSLTLNIWGLFAGLAFAGALYIALVEAKRKKINEDTIFDLAILALVGGAVGARAAYVIENWSYFSQNKTEILNFREGGLMFFGGALFVLLLVGIYLKRKKLNGWNIIDALVPSFAIGEFIGRIGCALSDLHIGTLTALPWAQEYVDGSTRHPIAIYMSANGLIMFIVFWLLRTKIKIEGALFLLFVLWYSGSRFFLDFLRCSDLDVCDPRYSGYTPSQYISAFIFVISSIYLFNLLNNPPTGGKKHMAEQQKNGEETAEGQANENNNLQGSVVSFTEIDEVIFENNGNESGGSATGEKKSTKDKLKELIKKPWVHALVIIIIFGLGVLGGSVYYNSVYYAKMFKNPPFNFMGKTWVATDRPIVTLKIVNDKTCEKCSVTEFVNQVKDEIIPTLKPQDIDYTSAEGKKLLADFGIKSLPALFFDANIEKAAVFEKVKSGLIKKDDLYYLSAEASGMPPGKFLELPKVSADDRIAGSPSAPVTIIEFSDFQCPYCKAENDVIKQVLAAYPDKVRLVFKDLPLPIHTNAQAAAEAAECAGDQGKFFEMGDVLFANQDKLDTASISKYAKDLKLDTAKFKECIDTGKFKAKIANDVQTATDFSVAGTPAFFVGEEFLGGAIPLEQFKQIIDAQLAKK